jgi:hypothetical protein
MYFHGINLFEGCLREVKAEELTCKKVHSLRQYDIVKAHVPIRRKIKHFK